MTNLLPEDAALQKVGGPGREVRHMRPYEGEHTQSTPVRGLAPNSIRVRGRLVSNGEFVRVLGRSKSFRSAR